MSGRTTIPENNANLQSAYNQLQEDYKKLQDEYTELKLEAEAKILKERERNPVKIVEVKHKGKAFVFNQPKVRYKGAIVDSEAVTDDAEYIASILAIDGQNILREDN